METKGTEHKTEDTPQDLNEIISKIVEVIEIERIYLSKGTSQQAFVYRLNIIAKFSRQDISEQIRPVINTVFKQHPDFSYRIFAFSYAHNEMQQRNLYFLNNCHANNLVYKTSEDNPIWSTTSKESNTLYEKIKQDFKRDMSRMKSFKKGIHYFKTQENLSQSAFMMHQTFEQGYRMLERFICGKIKVCHSIKNHQTFVLKSLSKLDGTFLIELDSDSKLIDLLENAYSSARYTHTYQISKTELNQLSDKLALFIKEIKILFNQELSVFKELVIHDKIDLNSEEIPEKFTKNSGLIYHERRFEFYNSFEMLCMAKSMMLLCVTCLQEDVEPPIEVNGFDYNIKDVLEFAIQLLPLKETSP